MHQSIVPTLLLLLFAAPGAQAAAGAQTAGAQTAGAQTAGAPAPIVFFDIAGPDQPKQAAFYRDVFGWAAGPGGTLSIPVTGPTSPGPALSGALRQDPAAKVIYLGVDDVTASLAQVTQHGGRVVQPRFEVKGVVVLGLFTDPAGNVMGLVELQNGRPKVP